VLKVHEETVFLRHVLGQDRRSSVGPIVLVLGAATLLGAAIAAVALQSPPANPSNGPSGPSPDANNPAPYIGLAGLGVLGLGIVLTAVPPSVHQDGATTFWSPSVGPESSLGGSFGFRF
jgi:hypothetical protein